MWYWDEIWPWILAIFVSILFILNVIGHSIYGGTTAGISAFILPIILVVGAGFMFWGAANVRDRYDAGCGSVFIVPVLSMFLVIFSIIIIFNGMLMLFGLCDYEDSHINDFILHMSN